MILSIVFNGCTERIASQKQLGDAMIRFDEVTQFELWMSVANGPSMCMLRNGKRAWLMYLRYEGDGGFTSIGDTGQLGNEEYTLSNGQKDPYPIAWCIDLAQCYKAIEYFHENNDERPEWIRWSES